MRANVICDFDGTIALEDVTDGLLDQFAAPAWRNIEAQWLAGEFGSRECMALQISLIEASCDEIDRYLDQVEIDPSFGTFVEECERRENVILNVVSDGIDYVVKRVLSNHAVTRIRVKANTWVALPNHRYRLEFPHAAIDCKVMAGTCKCAIAGSMASRRDFPTILIGDGLSDVCVATRADFVFAKDRLLAHCETNAIPHFPFNAFSDIEREFPRVLSRLPQSAQCVRDLMETSSDA